MHYLVEIEGDTFERKNVISKDQSAKIKYSKQRFVYLDPGESITFKLKNGTEKQILLVSVKEYHDSVINLVRRADVKIEINGKPITLNCAPYEMPTKIEGLRIQADTTSAWFDIPKRVQFSIWDASDPIVDTNLFSFPLPEYTLFSHSTQAYNEPVHLGRGDGDPKGQCFYHNYGVDLAGYEGRQKVVSCIEGIVVGLNRAEGDLSIRDNKGFILYYGHLDSILADVKIGSMVKRGQWVAMLGKRGASGNFSHLHIGAFLSEKEMTDGHLNRNLNLYPWIVTAYQQQYPIGLYAVARPHRTAYTGESILFEVKMHPLKGTPPPEIEIDSMDQRLRQGIDRGDVTAVAGIVRRTAELMMAAELAEDLEQGDMLVLDGSLQARFVQERRALDELYTMCMHKKVLATALCKSTRLLTCRGRAIENVLDHEGRWYYYPSCEITAEAHKAELYFVKLHRHSEFIFRFEVYKEQTQVDIGKVLGFLAVNARDAMIPGYPWGLVRADMLARVSNQEKEYLMHRHGIFGRTVHDVLDSAG